MVTQTLNPVDESTYYEKLGRETTWGRYLSELQKRTIVLAGEVCDGPRTVLEVGADGGRWSTLFVDQGWKAICTDVRPKALEVCQRRLEEAECILVKPTDATLPCVTGGASLILCMEVDPVISSEWFIEEASRVLTPGGVLVATLNNRSSLRAVFHKIARPDEAITRKQQGFYQVSYRDRKKRLSKCGFRMIHEEGCCWPPFARDSNSWLVSPCVQLERCFGLRRLPSLSPWVVFAAQKRRA